MAPYFDLGLTAAGSAAVITVLYLLRRTTGEWVGRSAPPEWGPQLIWVRTVVVLLILTYGGAAAYDGEFIGAVAVFAVVLPLGLLAVELIGLEQAALRLVWRRFRNERPRRGSS